MPKPIQLTISGYLLRSNIHYNNRQDLRQPRARSHLLTRAAENAEKNSNLMVPISAGSASLRETDIDVWRCRIGASGFGTSVK